MRKNHGSPLKQNIPCDTAAVVKLSCAGLLGLAPTHQTPEHGVAKHRVQRRPPHLPRPLPEAASYKFLLHLRRPSRTAARCAWGCATRAFSAGGPRLIDETLVDSSIFAPKPGRVHFWLLKAFDLNIRVTAEVDKCKRLIFL